MSDRNAIVILAAGKGTRLKMDKPKPLVPIENHALVDYVIEAVKDFGDLKIVTGYKEELVKKHIKDKHNKYSLDFFHQKEQLGTGHAVQTYFEQAKDALSYEYTFVVCADTPLIESHVLEELVNSAKENKYEALVASFTENNPKGYGRIIKSSKGLTIVEEKDATDDQRQVKEVNSGLYVFRTKYLYDAIKNLDNKNKSGEFYLTDTFKDDAHVAAKCFEDKNFFLGINDLHQLSIAERKYRTRLSKKLMLEGVRFVDNGHSYIYTKDIGQGTLIYPQAMIDSSSKIGKNVTIEMGAIIKNSIIEDGSHIKAYSYITDSHVGANSKVGPMAQLRPGSELGENVKIGNFVELKKSKLESNVSVSHLSYVGDAEIGQDVNIGCGFITCNYDGANKHKTIIGEGSFIGSDCQMIAPLNIGKECYVGSGSTINQDIPDGAFAIARQRQVTKEAMAKKFIKKKDK